MNSDPVKHTGCPAPGIIKPKRSGSSISRQGKLKKRGFKDESGSIKHSRYPAPGIIKYSETPVLQNQSGSGSGTSAEKFNDYGSLNKEPGHKQHRWDSIVEKKTSWIRFFF